jgi:hypothetical protein
LPSGTYVSFAIFVIVISGSYRLLSGAQAALASGVGSGAAANYTGAAAYNPTTLNPPSPPGATAMPTNFAIQPVIAVPPGASIPQKGSFFGFSVEMSVVNQVGKFVVYLEKNRYLIYLNSGKECVRSEISDQLDYRLM